MNTRHSVLKTPMGAITIVATGEAITGIYFAEHTRRPGRETFGPHVEMANDQLLRAAGRQLTEYLDGRRRTFELPLNAAGNDFQQAVWALVNDLPYGQTTTYGDIAADMGDRRLAYEVGQAVGANPLCIVVPCHRVVGANGALTGYAGGLARKRTLLELEEPVGVSAGRLF